MNASASNRTACRLHIYAQSAPSMPCAARRFLPAPACPTLCYFPSSISKRRAHSFRLAHILNPCSRFQVDLLAIAQIAYNVRRKDQSFQSHTCWRNFSMLTFLLFISTIHGCSSMRHGVARRAGSFSRLWLCVSAFSRSSGRIGNLEMVRGERDLE